MGRNLKTEVCVIGGGSGGRPWPFGRKNPREIEAGKRQERMKFKEEFSIVEQLQT